MAEPFTSKSAPKLGGQPATPTAFVEEPPVSYENVIAKPLRTPNFINLRHKNPTMSLFWGNKAVGDKESSLRFNQLLAMGFVPAKPEEVEDMQGNPCPEALARDGRVIYGDIILLKIPKADYLGALKWNAENAARRVKRFGVAMDGATAHQTAESRELPRSALADLPAKKTSAYIPPLQDIDSGTNLATK